MSILLYFWESRASRITKTMIKSFEATRISFFLNISSLSDFTSFSVFPVCSGFLSFSGFCSRLSVILLVPDLCMLISF
ncbi:predicted protein [Methanosarcina acetivorans C2A]|uniref:Uncharacterized protein n=1 Tax=Methanosarcina acetivorans (strain ATCC 35395 / DSM 2834 / JCM 12185 / C2A) TaxID=188937 RepID=Q8TKK2_METAC|nr:predicted protein [Methanosarcina acetivorans C2A]